MGKTGIGVLTDKQVLPSGEVLPYEQHKRRNTMEQKDKKVTYLIRNMKDQMRRDLKSTAAQMGISMEALILQVVGDYLNSEK